jgi:HD superfamily phosphodiesterase
MNVMMNFVQELEQEVYRILRESLSPFLYYHSVEHTIDVVNEAKRIATEEGISENDRHLLIIAALFHDLGFIASSEDHERRGCEMARKYLENSLLSSKEIETVCAAIMATKIPQKPTNLIGEILCDADLDYLGRADFFSIGNKLFLEIKHQQPTFSDKDWNKLQIKFLTQHQYFTKTNLSMRNPLKQEHLSFLKTL